MGERLFFALWPDPEVRRGLDEILRQLPAHHGKSPHREDLHITLVFLGELEEVRRRCAEAVADRLAGEPFRLRLDRVGYWPRPRILWCGASLVPEPLVELVGGLNRGLRGCGLKPERRAFAAHVTLARKARRVQPRELAQPLDWPVREFALIASRLDRPPPRYEVLGRWSLGS